MESEDEAPDEVGSASLTTLTITVPEFEGAFTVTMTGGEGEVDPAACAEELPSFT